MKTKTSNGLIILIMLSLVSCTVILPAQAADFTNFSPNQNLNGKITNVDATEFNKFFKSVGPTGKPNMMPLSSALVAAGNKYNMNSVFLMAVAAHESGWGDHAYKNNYFGYGTSSFSSPSQCVDFVAGKIKTDYLVNSGQYYHLATVNGWIVKWNKNNQSEKKDIMNIMNGFASWHVKTYGTPIKIPYLK